MFVILICKLFVAYVPFWCSSKGQEVPLKYVLVEQPRLFFNPSSLLMHQQGQQPRDVCFGKMELCLVSFLINCQLCFPRMYECFFSHFLGTERLHFFASEGYTT